MEYALTLNQAVMLAARYQHLVGQTFCGAYKELGYIASVTVAPYSDLHKSDFLEYYKAFRDEQKALSFFDNAQHFDVILISSSPNISMRELRAHLAYQDKETKHLELN